MWPFKTDIKEPAIAPISMPFLHPKKGEDGKYIDGMYVLIEPYMYSWLKDETLYRIIVPAGFETDIASVPQIFWSFGFTPDGKQRAAAVIHDWLFNCEYHWKGVCPAGSFQKFDEDKQEWVDITEPWTVDKANLLFARILREAGVNVIKRRLMYRAVDLFGWTLWKEKKDDRMLAGTDNNHKLAA